MNRNPLWVLLASMLVSSAIFAQSSPGTTAPPKSTTPKAETTKPSTTERESSSGEKPDLYINSQSSFEFNSKDEGSTVDYIEYKIGYHIGKGRSDKDHL